GATRAGWPLTWPLCRGCRGCGRLEVGGRRWGRGSGVAGVCRALEESVGEVAVTRDELRNRERSRRVVPPRERVAHRGEGPARVVRVRRGEGSGSDAVGDDPGQVVP